MSERYTVKGAFKSKFNHSVNTGLITLIKVHKHEALSCSDFVVI